jgi:hypothetical protein
MHTFKITLILLCFLFYSCNNKTKDKNTREFKVTPQKFDSPPDTTELKDRESFEDSIVDYKVSMDNGNYWEAKNPKLKNKKIAFNKYSGKILIYLNKKSNRITDKTIADDVFVWDFDTIQPFKIKGVYGWTDKDTLMYWIYNIKKDILTDEKGNVFKRIN